MMKGRDHQTKATPSTDLLVCFPSRARLALTPKPICSPARPSEPNKRHHHHRKKSISSRGGGGGQAQASPLLWTKTKSMGSEISSEPTSPKVTCAGQIKVRPKSSTTACRSWQSVMEEIEKIHSDKKQRKRLNWAESLGFKKEIMQFLTCLRTIRFDLRCFGSFSGTDITTEDEEDEDDDVEGYHENHVATTTEDDERYSRTVFSKWFMVLQEDQNVNGVDKEVTTTEENDGLLSSGGGEVPVPPPNALLLMRCRSAPAKSWLRESSEGGGDGNDEKEENSSKEKMEEKGKAEAQVVIKKGQSLKSLMEEEKRKKENLVVMRRDSDNNYYGISSDIATETWIVGGLRDPMSRSRSWKR